MFRFSRGPQLGQHCFIWSGILFITCIKYMQYWYKKKKKKKVHAIRECHVTGLVGPTCSLHVLSCSDSDQGGFNSTNLDKHIFIFNGDKGLGPLSMGYHSKEKLKTFWTVIAQRITFWTEAYRILFGCLFPSLRPKRVALNEPFPPSHPNMHFDKRIYDRIKNK